MNTENMIEKQKIINEAIDEMIAEYLQYPFVYVYEADIRSRLYNILFNKLHNSDKNFQDAAYLSPSIQNVRTTLLHCEVCCGQRRHVDIGIWKVNELSNEERSYKEKEIEIAIEIKYNWEKSITRGLKNGIRDDIQKIAKRGIKNGYFLIFRSQKINNKELEEIDDCLNNYVNCPNNFIFYVIGLEKAFKKSGSSWYKNCDNFRENKKWREV